MVGIDRDQRGGDRHQRERSRQRYLRGRSEGKQLGRAVEVAEQRDAADRAARQGEDLADVQAANSAAHSQDGQARADEGDAGLDRETARVR